MTSELRSAVEVWLDAYEASYYDEVDDDRAAAAVIEADREAVRAYWYRQGKDDGWQMCKENEIDRLREELAEAYIKLSGKSIHTSDCATSYAPAMEPGPCNCDAPGDADLVSKLRDEDSYYRLQEKHWCIDAEELERQRLAAADRIEALEALLKEAGEALDMAAFRLQLLVDRMPADQAGKTAKAFAQGFVDEARATLAKLENSDD